MRRLIIILFLLLALSVQSKAEKRAYLVCIGDYPKEKGWAQISSDNDLSILLETLSEDFVVESVSDSLATYYNVVSFLNSITLKISPSDTVLIHFSCHGQQMNMKADSSEPDSLDEALVLYDSWKEYSQNYRGQCHLTDNEFGEIAEQLRYSIGDGGLLIVTFDACHSDSMYRGDEKPVINGTKIRGYAGIFGPEPDSLTLAMLREKRSIQDTSAVQKYEGQCDALFISACKSNSRNKETVQNGLGYGSLSYSVSFAYREAGGLRDMGKFISLVLSEMRALHPGQEPVVRSSFPISIENNTSENEQITESSVWWKCCFAFGLLAIVVAALLWIKKRPKIG